ncbi:hypothetical protein L226DRAFT_574184 [Lentinus tigrinus ALCF2SS1-7]|uniref:Uncharacterized protein n=1 Tax=Lentinus tigrinus ALCF2SS1-6 TaxID=1328759 RepID=A0A5C2S0B9_9APHY|nr:hypothetical protein L227DRAFT_614205 [Lentinus tigrinus ALCF2SS1-6]RPD71179.1 hypothetical protein L226DRAFT_574184 [Lentinus tigrinus ALCF2SS1-7]
MAPLKRHYTIALTTSEQDIPVATSDPVVETSAPRRSSRLRASSTAPTASSSRQPSFAPASRRSSPRAPSTIQTTPARPLRSNKGKGLHQRQHSISEDPNLSPFRNPAYVAPQLAIPSDAPEALLRPESSPLQGLTPQTPPLRRRKPARRRQASSSPQPLQSRAQPPSPPPNEQNEEDDDYDVQLPYTTENNVVFNYPPHDPNDNYWFEEMYGHIEADGYIKRLLGDVKNAVAHRLLHSTTVELELGDLLKNYDRMLREIGVEQGEKYEKFLRQETGLLVVPGRNEEGVVHFRQAPPPSQPLQLNSRIFGAPVVPNGPSAPRTKRIKHIELGSEELVPTEPVEPRSSSVISSPSNNASFRAQKRRIEAASSASETVFIDFPKLKRRRTTPGPVFRYSPLPPSSPLPSTHASSSESGSPRPEPARLSPVAEEAAEAEAEAVVPVAEESAEVGNTAVILDSDPSWIPDGSDVENIDPNGKEVSEVLAAVEKMVATTKEAEDNVPPPAPIPDEVYRARWEAIFPYYVPPPSSQMDIPMAWPPRSDEVVDEENKDGAGEEAEADTSFGQSVSAALARAKGKGKGKGKAVAKEERKDYVPEDPLAVEAREFWAKTLRNRPEDGSPLMSKEAYRKQAEDKIWPPYNSQLYS